MRDGPDISRIASLVGDPARANMLTALMDGGALTASELALEAGVTAQTASSHLGKLMEGGLLSLASAGPAPLLCACRPAGRGDAGIDHRRCGASRPEAHEAGAARSVMREARICYDHLAGDHAVAMLDGFPGARVLTQAGDEIRLGKAGPAHFAALGIDTDAFGRQRRPICRACLDWSVRRSHLAGALGAAILDKIIAEKWARRDPESRAIVFSPKGRRSSRRLFGLD